MKPNRVRGEVKVMWERFSDGREACYWFRDRDGFCLLENRCWSGKSCPKTPGWADRYRNQLIDDIARKRDAQG